MQGYHSWGWKRGISLSESPSSLSLFVLVRYLDPKADPLLGFFVSIVS